MPSLLGLDSPVLVPELFCSFASGFEELLSLLSVPLSELFDESVLSELFVEFWLVLFVELDSPLV